VLYQTESQRINIREFWIYASIQAKIVAGIGKKYLPEVCVVARISVQNYSRNFIEGVS